ncbi:MAG: tripartite tricarboxylate transporter TctB family protein [Deltaproteobacteria bacterium]|nr:tripartite tricarboxylate transporter TctB family protein [Deltaproteobacteria bacterium]
MKKSSTVTTIVFLAFALGAVIEASKLPFGRMSAPQPGFFPIVLSALLAIISVLVLVEVVKGREEASVAREQMSWKRIGLALGALFAYAFLFEVLGYLVTTFLFVTFLLRVVDRKGWGMAIAVAFSASFVSYVLFGLLLHTPLPAGLLPI